MAAVWPDWEISEQALPELACYVDPEARGVPLGSHLRSQWEDAAAGRTRAGDLYRLLSERDIQYAHDPWNPARFGVNGSRPKQRIRTPAEVLQGVGSCLDLSILFAGMAMACGIRPFIAATLGAETPHALVVLDLAKAMSSMTLSEREEGPGRWRLDGEGRGMWRPESPAEPGVPQGRPWWRPNQSRWLLVDIARVAGSGAELAQPFAAACLAEFPWAPAANWILVDVEAAREGRSSFEPPVGRARYPIHSYLPELPEFRDYPGRQDSIREILGRLRRDREEGKPSRLVLHGPGGRGKSLLAQRLAWAADNGCGWFLNATDTETLKVSLAMAEQTEIGQLSETGAGAERPNAIEVEQLSRAALGRLDSSDVPWVVVLDNCDSPPETAGLAAYIPQPRKSGQVVIITTRDEKWSAAPGGWASTPVPALTTGDLAMLDLPAALADVAAEPLVAEPLAALRANGAAIPAGGREDPSRLVWSMLLEVLGAGSAAVRLARLLAWAPPEPMDVAAAPVGADFPAQLTAAADLVRLRFVAPIARLGGSQWLDRSGLDTGNAAAAPGGESDGRQQTRRVQLHRLFGEAIRTDTWQSGEPAVLAVLAELLTSPWGSQAFIDSPDQTALQFLENGELERATKAGAARRTAGLAWQGLGHIRERRGPVADSGPAFRAALGYLDPVTDPYQVAEAQIGLARIAYQERAFNRGRLLAAQEAIIPARELLTAVPDAHARQLREQGNALFWLIEQRLAGTEKDPQRRLSLLTRVRDELWRSYEQRLRIARDAPEGEPMDHEPPLPEDGLGPERAYYNLAGVYLQLAKSRYDSAPERPEESGEGQELVWLDGVADDLAQASKVYRKVADLRARRYREQPHPHHAACIHGNAIVAYHRAALLRQHQYLIEAARWVAAGLEERWQVASFSLGASRDQVIRDNDVAKSFGLLGKIAAAGFMASGETTGDGVGSALAVTSEALSELLNWSR